MVPSIVNQMLNGLRRSSHADGSVDEGGCNSRCKQISVLPINTLKYKIGALVTCESLRDQRRQSFALQLSPPATPSLRGAVQCTMFRKIDAIPRDEGEGKATFLGFKGGLS